MIESLAWLSESERQAAVASLTDEEAIAFEWDWRNFARLEQLRPENLGHTKTHWLVLAGRGFGKTRTGAETVRQWAAEPLEAPIHIAAPTASDIRKVMIEGPSGLLSCYPPSDRPRYEPSKGHMITWANGNIAYCFSADEPERLRGPQCGRYWADELCAWRFAQDAWDNLTFGFRAGNNLQGVITTTPKPTKLLKQIIADSTTIVTRGSSYDNRANLAPEFLNTIVSKYEGTRIGRQELLAEILEDIPGALWTREMIDKARVQRTEVEQHKHLIYRIVVAIDPAVSNTDDSDETGIVVLALTRSAHVLILDDLTCRESPLGWARIAVNAYRKFGADRIIAEVNNGGDLVEANIRAVSPDVAFRAVRASRGKTRRAEPVAAVYEQGRVHHVGSFPELEDQMCAYNPKMETSDGESPDRMDALVWGVTALLIDQEAAAETFLV